MYPPPIVAKPSNPEFGEIGQGVHVRLPVVYWIKSFTIAGNESVNSSPFIMTG